MGFSETVDGIAIGVPVRLGKYTLLTRLATGGMGEVYVAQMSGAAGFAKQVVIKRILPQLARDEHFVRMFLDEARITAQLNHPNICQVFELGEIAGEYYISMEYLEGLPLSSLLEKHAPGGLDLRIAAGVMTQACEGLAHAHEFSDADRGIDGVVHRDISPQNLFVTTAGLVKVLDFGVAKLHREGSKTVTHSAKGKYMYMSPEQVHGEPLDRRSDIFAVGVVLFEVITGRNLFRRDTELETLQAVISSDRPRVSDLRSSVPQAVSDVVDRALSVNRNQRYASTRTLAEALTRVMAPMGGPASITELAEFVRREHTAEITAQRERIRRASKQMQAVVPPELFDGGSEPESGASPYPSRPTTPVPGEQSPAGRSYADSHSGISVVERASSVVDVPPPHRRYARWGIPAGVTLAVALWFGYHFFDGASRAATPQPALVAAATATDAGQPAAAAVGAGDTDEPAPPDASVAGAAPADAGGIAARDPSARDPDAGSSSSSDRVRGRHGSRARGNRDRRGSNDDDGRNQTAKQKEAGYLTIDATPYAEIYVDGKRIGITPLFRIPLTAGRHTIRAVSERGATKRVLLRIKPEETVSHRIRFSDIKNQE